MKIIHLIIASSLLLITVNSEAAQNKQQTERELAELKQAIIAVQKDLKQNQLQQSSTEKKLQQADKALSKASGKLKQTQRKVKTQQTKLANLKQEQKNKHSASQQQKRLLAGQLRSAYISGDQEYIKLLLNQQDPAKIARMLKYYDYLNKARIKDIQTLKDTLTRLNQVGLEISSSLEQLQQLQQQQKQQRSQQQVLKQQQKDALSALRKDYASDNQRLSKLKRNEAELQTLLNQLSQRLKNFSPPQSLVGLAKFKKKLSWPTKGKVLHRFGSKKFDTSLRWNGIIIAANSGREVKAIQQGQVVFSDWLRGFGLITIIDHGKGYLSLYGHNEALLKNAGDFVEPGEPIATIGQSGGFSQPGLYFEVRYKGKPQNPLKWIKN